MAGFLRFQLGLPGMLVRSPLPLTTLAPFLFFWAASLCFLRLQLGLPLAGMVLN